MTRCLPRGLYVITDPSVRHWDELSRQVAASLAGGAITVQYRDKTDDHARRTRIAERLAMLCHDAGAVFIVNDDLDLANACGADGVHLGQADAACKEARRALQPGALIGVSCYDSIDRARAAETAGADYVALGSAYPSVTKPGAVHAPLELYRRVCSELQIPVVAIGGITPNNAAPLIAAGCHALAVINSVFGVHDVRQAARQLQSLFDHERRSPGLE